MIVNTTFSNIKFNAAFYILNADELFIKNNLNEFWDTTKKQYIKISATDKIFCDDSMLIVQKAKEVKPKKCIIW